MRSVSYFYDGRFDTRPPLARGHVFAAVWAHFAAGRIHLAPNRSPEVGRNASVEQMQPAVARRRPYSRGHVGALNALAASTSKNCSAKPRAPAALGSDPESPATEKRKSRSARHVHVPAVTTPDDGDSARAPSALPSPRGAKRRVPLRLSRRSRGLRWLVRIILALTVLEVAYLGIANLWVLPRLTDLATRSGYRVQHTGLSSLYPGDLRASVIEVTGWRIVAKTHAVRGRMRLLSWLRGTVEVEWLEGNETKVRVQQASEPVAYAAPATSTIEAGSLLAGRIGIRFSSGLILHRVHLRVREFDFSGVHLSGVNELYLGSLTVEGGRTRAEGRIELKGTEIERRTSPQLAGCDGSLSLVIATPDATPSNLHLHLKGALRGYIGDLGALLNAGPPLTLSGVEMHADLDIQDGRLAPGSTLDVRSREADLARAVGALAPKGVRALDLHLHYALDQGQGPVAGGQLSLRSPSIEIEQSTLGEIFSLTFDAQLHGLLQQLTRVTQATAVLSRNTATGTSGGLLRATLSVSEATFSRADGLQLSGRVDANGDDAGKLLDALRPEPAVKWMLADLEGSPFALSSNVAVDSGRIAFEKLTLSTRLASGTGGLFVDARSRGAFLFERGSFAIGVEFDGQSAKLEQSPGEQWLSSALDVARRE